MKCHSLEVTWSMLNPGKKQVHGLPALPSPSVRTGEAEVLPDASMGTLVLLALCLNTGSLSHPPW